MWKLSAFAEDTNSIYTYFVAEAEESEPEDVATIAYAIHGERHRRGEVTEFLGDLYTVSFDLAHLPEETHTG